MKKKKDWFKSNKYPHIGKPLHRRIKKSVAPFVKNQDAIANYAFLPLIHRTLRVRKFRKEICHDGSRSKLRKLSFKKREIFYPSHLDSNIYSYYSFLLNQEYEKRLVERNISEAVTAYRKIPLDKNDKNSRNKCNIDFAKDVFDYIKCQERELVAITFDIKSFFDSLNHKLLKESWKKVLELDKELPKHHYNVFRSLIKFSYVEEYELFDLMQNQILVERKNSLNKTESKKKFIAKKRYLRDERAIAYCLKDDIRNIRKKGLIKSNKYVFKNGIKKLRTNGIPQGTPISATAANFYMMDFDESISKKLEKDYDGIYRRYSDDMIIICSKKYRENVINYIKDEIKKVDLEIQHAKTQIFEFRYFKKEKTYRCFEYNLLTKKYQTNTKFEYLGFQFDGKRVLLKDASVANYYRKMKRSVSRGKFYALRSKPETRGELFKTFLYKRFTIIGSHRRRKYERDRNNPSKFIKTEHYDWGNFHSYVNLAEKIMPGNGIKKQMKRHWKKFHDYMKPY
jgi:retron-type reverse transcriptase